MDITIQRILECLKEKNLLQKDLTRFLDLKENSFASWKSERNKSYLKYLHAIASYLDVDVEYLKGETDTKKAPLSVESEAAAEFANLYQSLTAEQRQLILAAMRGMKQEQ